MSEIEGPFPLRFKGATHPALQSSGMTSIMDRVDVSFFIALEQLGSSYTMVLLIYFQVNAPTPPDSITAEQTVTTSPDFITEEQIITWSMTASSQEIQNVLKQSPNIREELKKKWA